MIGFDLGSDLFPLAAALLTAISCALLGNFLVVSRLSLMGDAISHSVLPGLVAAFVLTGSRSTPAIFLGAAGAGVITAILVELVKRLGRLEPGAAMGVVFSVLFALGVLMIEQFARQIDLDAECVLHGQLETLVWYSPPETLSEALSIKTWLGSTVQPALIDAESGEIIRNAIIRDGVPRQVWTLLLVCVISAVFVVGMFKELRIVAFDPALATVLGFHATATHFLLMIVVAGATVAAFEAVGSILVIAMLICPAAAARLLTDRLSTQIVLSVVLAIGAAFGGYFAARGVPLLFGSEVELSAAGTVTVVLGGMVALATAFSPRHGVLARVAIRRRLASRVRRDDALGLLYRAEENGQTSLSPEALNRLGLGRGMVRGLLRCAREGLTARDSGGAWALTESGRIAGRDLIRRHRLWEHYLVERAGLPSDHVHDTAERFEHFEPVPESGPSEDPHGKRIPR